MATILNTFNCTGHLIYSDSNSIGERPFCSSDTVSLAYDIYFCVEEAFINEKRLEIGLPRLQYPSKLIVYLCNEIVGDAFTPISSVEYDLSSNSVLQGVLNTKINSVFDDHDTFCKNLTPDEILSMCKEYKIIFRLSNGVPDDSNNLLSGDIVNNIKVIPDFNDQGPYDVEYNFFDFLNPNSFTDSERIQAYNSVKGLFGYEGITIYNAKNCSNMPLFIMVHGYGHPHFMYNQYASKLASYGYCVWLMSQESYAASDTQPNLILQKIQFLKDNIGKITNNKLLNKINFTKLAISGHSQGSQAVAYMLDALPISSTSSIGINDFFAFSLIGPLPTVYGNTGFRVTDINKVNYDINIPLVIIGGDTDASNQGIAQHVMACNYSKGNDGIHTVPVYLINNINKGHGSPGIDVTQIDVTTPISESINTNYFYDYNSILNSVDYCSQKLLLYFANSISNKIINFININCIIKQNIFTENRSNLSFESVYEIKNNISHYIDIFDTNKLGSFLFTDIASPTLVTENALDLALDQFSSLFNGIITTAPENSGGIVFQFNSNKYLSYRINSLNMINDKYIVIYGAHSATQSSTDDLSKNIHFCLELIDADGNSSTISSKINNKGIPVQVKKLSAAGNKTGFRSTCPIKFDLNNFKLKNNNLNLSNIAEIALRFGPSYGTSSSTIAIHKVLVVK